MHAMAAIGGPRSPWACPARTGGDRGVLLKRRRPGMRTLSGVIALVALVSVGAAGQVAVVVERIQDLDLTDAQEAKIAEIRKQHQPKVQAAAKELGTFLKDEHEKIRNVLTAEQQKQIQALKEERKDHREECVAHAFASLKELDLTDAEMTRIGEIRKEYRPKIENALKELDGLLSDTQKKAREDALKAGKPRRELVASLNLTDAQKAKVAVVAKQVGAIVREESEKIHDLLTASQKEQLPVLQEERKERVRDRMAHRIANFQELNLSDDQKAKITAIRQEFRPKIHEAGNKLRAAVREEVEQIVAVFKG
jgi:Spy/CpxP family protein refolding chaperone